MTIPEQEPTPFEALSDFEKPERCDFHFTSAPNLFEQIAKTRTTIGYRMGDPNIYYKNGFFADHAPIPEPLEDIDLDNLPRVFLGENDRMTLLKLWNAAHKRKLSNENTQSE